MVYLASILVAWGALAWGEPAALTHPTGDRTTPPTIDSIRPQGLARGATTTLKVAGFNLLGSDKAFFSGPGVRGEIVSVEEAEQKKEVQRLGSGGLPSTIDLGPLPTRYEVTVSVTVDDNAEIGARRFRLHTPLGTTPMGKVLIEPAWAEVSEVEPNDQPAAATPAATPGIWTGTISRPEDQDYYQVAVKQGDSLVFWNASSELGSALTPVISIMGPDHTILREFGGSGQTEQAFEQTFARAGTYYVRVSDYTESGSEGHFYRMQVGPVPLVEAVYPLGLRRGESSVLALHGFHLKSKELTVNAAAKESERELLLRPSTPAGPAFNTVKLELDDLAAVENQGENVSLATALPLQVPIAVNGKLARPGAHYFRFAAKKDELIVMEVAARRFGSQLDSLIEVLDLNGKPVERATLRAVFETKSSILLRTPTQPALRMLSWEGVAVGDYVMAGAEVLRVAHLPRGPDEDVLFDAVPPVPMIPLNQAENPHKLTFLNTTPEAHGLDKSIYEIEIRPPGSQFANNGLPIVHLPYINDDGGLGYGTDSRLDFTAPADGEYVLRLQDSRGTAGERHAYRLKLRRPQPDYEVTVTPRNPNVPVGSRIPVVVAAYRFDGFDGPIRVEFGELPAGVSASAGVIPAGQSATTLLLDASADAQPNQVGDFAVKATATIDGADVARWASAEEDLKLVSVIAPADLTLTAATKEVILEPGGTAKITVNVQRHNGFAGRVPVHVFNVPKHVDLPESGLNGVLIDEDQQERSFTIRALSTAKPMETKIFVVGQVETRSPLKSLFAGEPIVLKVVAGKSD